MLVVAAGCSGDDPAAGPPPPTPPTSPVTTTSPTPTSAPAPPRLPAAAKENTKAGAVAFVHHYIDLVNYLRLNGDAAALRRLSAADCTSCAAMIRVAESTYAEGGYIRGGRWHVRGLSGLRSAGTWQIVADIRVAKQRYRPRADAPVENRRAERATLIFVVERSRPQWVLKSLERQTDA